MRTYRFIEHTADIRLHVEASDLQELFLAAIEGMGHLIKTDLCTNKKTYEIKEQIEVSSIDETTLLIDFLSEILTHSQVNKAVYCKATFKQLDKNFVSATILGSNTDSFDEDIKAVTYHEADIKKNEKGNLETVIIFDI